MGERIEETRTDPTVKSYGAHHVICAGCNEEIASEGRRDIYHCSLWNKHKLEKCAGLARWATHPPSQEDMKAWQVARNKCAEISVSSLCAMRRCLADVRIADIPIGKGPQDPQVPVPAARRRP